MKTTTFSPSAVRRTETDRVAKVRLSDRQIAEIAAVEISEHESPLLDRALAWFEKQPETPSATDLQQIFKLHPAVAGGRYGLYEAEDVRAAIARHFAAKRLAARCQQLRADYGLLRPSFAAKAKCSPVAFQIWEAEYLAYALRKGIADTSRMGYDSVGHWGASTTTIEQIWFLSGCKDSPKLRFLMGYEMRRDPSEVCSRYLIKKSHSLQECKDILRGANFVERANIYWGAHSFSAKQLRTIGRVSVPVRHALLIGSTITMNQEGCKRPFCIRLESGEKLNYAFASEVQKWSPERQASTFLSAKAAHFYLGGNTEEWIAKQEAERLALDSTDLNDILAECRRIIEACAGIIPTPSTHVIRISEAVKVGCTYITVRHGREANMNSETLGIALAILEAYEASLAQQQAA